MDYKVQLQLETNYKIKIKSNHDSYLKDMKEEFSIHVPNYFFMPKFKCGSWDGKQHFITEAGMMPYGLLLDFIKIHKKLFPDLKIEADDGVRNLFKGPELEINYNLKFQPRPYQKEAIETCLKYTKGLIVSSTASGKSLVISYIIKTLLNNASKTNVKNAIIVVPSTSLIAQFKKDMIDYGISENHIGKVYADFKEWNKTIVISTWQTLKNNLDKLDLYNCIIGDEIHQAKAFELKKIFSKSKAKYRFGFTGTMPTAINELYSIKSFLGNVLKEYPSGLLADQGYISKCNVHVYKRNPIIESNNYKEIKDKVFHDVDRLDFIGNLVNDIDDNVLLLVSYISEGDKLLKLLNRRTNKEVVFLSGTDSVDVREEWREKIIKSKNIAIIATYQIFQQGINIPNLKYLILSSPTKSKIRTLQSIGRTLRLYENKIDGAIIFDIIDEVKFLSKHGEKRLEYYEKEGFNIEFKQSL
jgi:superfamily II DNA or RNA helicase